MFAVTGTSIVVPSGQSPQAANRSGATSARREPCERSSAPSAQNSLQAYVSAVRHDCARSPRNGNGSPQDTHRAGCERSNTADLPDVSGLHWEGACRSVRPGAVLSVTNVLNRALA